VQGTTRLVAAAWILIAVGIVETIILVHAILHESSFSGGSLIYCYVGYKLLNRSHAIYKWVTRILLLYLSLLIAGLLAATIFSAQFMLARDLSIGLHGDPMMLTVALYLLFIPLVAALLYHPDTRSQFGIKEPNKSPWTLYMGVPRALGVTAFGAVLMALLIGPHLLSNPFKVIVSALQNDERVLKIVGRPETLVLLDAREGNWTFTASVRAEKGTAVGFYYVDVEPDKAVKIDSYAYQGIPEPQLAPRVQAKPAVPETSAEGAVNGAATTLLSTSFEVSAADLSGSVAPFTANGKVAWKRDVRARTGEFAINVIPDGNPGRLDFFNKPVNTALLSSRLDGSYKPFRVSPFRRVELQFWRFSTSNPSTTHNCLGSMSVSYRLDGGDWRSKMVYCGAHKSEFAEWRYSKLEFDTDGRHELEIRFEYEYPPSTRIDKTAVYLIDDLLVRAH